jgi:hypothetical protein
VAISAVIEASADRETLLQNWAASSNDIDAQDAQDAPVGAGANTEKSIAMARNIWVASSGLGLFLRSQSRRQAPSDIAKPSDAEDMALQHKVEAELNNRGKSHSCSKT